MRNGRNGLSLIAKDNDANYCFLIFYRLGMLDINDIWKLACCEMTKKLAENNYNNWISPIMPLSLDKGKLVLGVPNDTYSWWLSENYKDFIEEAIEIATSMKLSVQFEEVAPASVDKPSDEKPVNVATPTKENGSATAAKEKKQPASHEKQVIGSTSLESGSDKLTLDRRFTFESFVVGDSNKFAFSACMTVASEPGTKINPLFIHSSTGLGKTHLLQGIASRILTTQKNARVMYINSEDFMNQYVDAMLRRDLSAFRNKMRNLDVLLIDDVQFLANREGFQEELFHTFNSLFNLRKQIVMTSDCPPHAINGLDKRLCSRFEWGLTTEILPPDLETRIAIIKKKQEEQNFKLSDEVIEFIASHLKSNVRRLESAVFKLISWASISNVKMDVPLAEKLLGDIIGEEAGTIVSIEEIQRVVADFFGIGLVDMTSKKRPANIAVPRMVAMYFARKLTSFSLPSIADKFQRNHATVLHAVSTIEKRGKEDEEFKRSLSLLERKLAGL